MPVIIKYPQAKIEIYARDVDLFQPFRPVLGENTPQHLFILYTDTKGNKEIIRAGPEKDGIAGIATSNIEVVRQKYERTETYRPKDWVEPEQLAQLPKTTYTGTEADMSAKFNKMWEAGEQINLGKYDYKLAAPWKTEAPELWHSQNSNASARHIVIHGGLDFITPKYASGKEVFVPGVNAEFKHTTADRTTNCILRGFASGCYSYTNQQPVPFTFDIKKAKDYIANSKGSNTGIVTWEKMKENKIIDYSPEIDRFHKNAEYMAGGGNLYDRDAYIIIC